MQVLVLNDNNGWVEFWVNGELKHSGHSIPMHVLFEVLGIDATIVWGNFDEDTGEFISDNGEKIDPNEFFVKNEA